MIFEGTVETQEVFYNQYVLDAPEKIEFTGYVTKFPEYRWKCNLSHDRLTEMLTSVGMPVMLDTKYGNVEFLQ